MATNGHKVGVNNRMLNMSYKDFRALKPEKPNKYRNVKTEVDGIRFDSLKEANYYCQLKLLKRQGEIVDFFRQVPFLLQEGYWKGELGTEEWVSPIYYKADFMVIELINIFETNGNLRETMISIEIHEVKGYKKNRAWEIKRKMFQARYPEYELRII